MIRESFVRYLAREAISTDTFTITTQISKSGQNFILDTVTVCEENVAGKVVDIGIRRFDSTFYLSTVTLTSSGYFYQTRFNVVIPSDWKIVVRCRTPTKGSAYVVIVCGHLEDKL